MSEKLRKVVKALLNLQTMFSDQIPKSMISS